MKTIPPKYGIFRLAKSSSKICKPLWTPSIALFQEDSSSKLQRYSLYKLLLTYWDEKYNIEIIQKNCLNKKVKNLPY
jgi:hypothetical protein